MEGTASVQWLMDEHARLKGEMKARFDLLAAKVNEARYESQHLSTQAEEVYNVIQFVTTYFVQGKGTICVHLLQRGDAREVEPAR